MSETLRLYEYTNKYEGRGRGGVGWERLNGIKVLPDLSI